MIKKSPVDCMSHPSGKSSIKIYPLFFHRINRPPAEKREMTIEEIRKQCVEREIRMIKHEIESFKRYGLSFVIDDFHRSDGKIVERTVLTNLEIYTDKISEEEYETGNIEDLDYIDKFKFKFLFPVLARRKFDNVEPVEIRDPSKPITASEVREAFDKRDIQRPSIMPVTIEEQTKRPKIIHLKDINGNLKDELYRNIPYIPYFTKIYNDQSYLEEEEMLFDILVEKLMTTDSIDNLEEKSRKDEELREIEELMKEYI